MRYCDYVKREKRQVQPSKEIDLWYLPFQTNGLYGILSDYYKNSAYDSYVRKEEKSVIYQHQLELISKDNDSF